MDHEGLMIEFRTQEDTRLAADTLEELGYEPHLHDAARLHFHVRNEDLTSALEIIQCHGGRIVDRSPAEVSAITNDAYDMDAIPIPAHTVNEDWDEHYTNGVETAARTDEEAFPADDAPYDRFDAT